MDAVVDVVIGVSLQLGTAGTRSSRRPGRPSGRRTAGSTRAGRCLLAAEPGRRVKHYRQLSGAAAGPEEGLSARARARVEGGHGPRQYRSRSKLRQRDPRHGRKPPLAMAVDGDAGRHRAHVRAPVISGISERLCPYIYKDRSAPVEQVFFLSARQRREPSARSAVALPISGMAARRRLPAGQTPSRHNGTV